MSAGCSGTRKSNSLAQDLLIIDELSFVPLEQDPAPSCYSR